MQKRRTSSRKIAVIPPSLSLRPVPRYAHDTVRVRLPAAGGREDSIANRALPCNVWECPHYPPAWQGDLRPNFPRAFTPSKINGVINKFPHTGAENYRRFSNRVVYVQFVRRNSLNARAPHASGEALHSFANVARKVCAHNLRTEFLSESCAHSLCATFVRRILLPTANSMRTVPCVYVSLPHMR